MKDCIDSTYVSSVGKFVDQFEADLVKYTKSKYAIATVNGTAALHIALKLVNLKKDDEVLIPSLSFVATANAVTYSNATPHFVDSAPNTLGIDPEKLNDYLSTHTEQKSGFCFNKSTNKRITKRTISKIKWGQLDGGTAIGMGLGSAVNRLKDSEAKSKVIILLTDGVNNSGFVDPKTATELAKGLNIKYLRIRCIIY